MKIISIETGRTTWLFPVEEFTPLAGADGRAIVREFAERYSFAVPPENLSREELDKNGLKFSAGQFEHESQQVSILEFVLYNDGLVAVANTTERSTAFLEDAFQFLIGRFNFRMPISPIRKVNVSIVTVEFDASVNALLAQQERLISLVGQYLNAPLQTSHPVEVSRLDFSLNIDGLASAARPKLIIESRVTVSLERRRFYSNAAMHTKAHLELLAAIEQTFLQATH